MRTEDTACLHRSDSGVEEISPISTRNPRAHFKGSCSHPRRVIVECQPTNTKRCLDSGSPGIWARTTRRSRVSSNGGFVAGLMWQSLSGLRRCWNERRTARWMIGLAELVPGSLCSSFSISSQGPSIAAQKRRMRRIRSRFSSHSRALLSGTMWCWRHLGRKPSASCPSGTLNSLLSSTLR